MATHGRTAVIQFKQHRAIRRADRRALEAIEAELAELRP